MPIGARGHVGAAVHEARALTTTTAAAVLAARVGTTALSAVGRLPVMCPTLGPTRQRAVKVQGSAGWSPIATVTPTSNDERGELTQLPQELLEAARKPPDPLLPGAPRQRGEEHQRERNSTPFRSECVVGLLKRHEVAELVLSIQSGGYVRYISAPFI